MFRHGFPLGRESGIIKPCRLIGRHPLEREAEMTIAAIVRVRDTAVITIAPDMQVRDALALLADKRIGAVPVTVDDEVVGILSERDLIYGLRRDGPAFLDLDVRRAMTSPVISVHSGTTPLEALGMMTKRRIRHLPVIDDGVMVGFVSIGDLVKARLEHVENEAAALREYIQTA
jgi:CBS domain-containing protein